MKTNKYCGHMSQLYGVEEHRLVGGKKDGMRILEIKNGLGLEMTVSLDRGGDIARLSLKGVNLGYFTPNGYVHPSYYDDKGIGFLKSFTAGFLTTCGLAAVGAPCVDNGEELPLHGKINNTPVESYHYEVGEEEIVIYERVSDEIIFSHKLVLDREIHILLKENTFNIVDKVTNTGDQDYPVMILYHMNMGYPLLSENAEITIPSTSVKGRTPLAEKEIGLCNKMIPPTAGYEERCYFHKFSKESFAQIYNKDIQTGVRISFDKDNLKYFTEWKMMGYRDYVLGLEPGNCHPDGRDQMRKENALTILKPEESVTYKVKVELFNN